MGVSNIESTLTFVTHNYFLSNIYKSLLIIITRIKNIFYIIRIKQRPIKKSFVIFPIVLDLVGGGECVIIIKTFIYNKIKRNNWTIQQKGTTIMLITIQHQNAQQCYKNEIIFLLLLYSFASFTLTTYWPILYAYTTNTHLTFWTK